MPTRRRQTRSRHRTGKTNGQRSRPTNPLQRRMPASQPSARRPLHHTGNTGNTRQPRSIHSHPMDNTPLDNTLRQASIRNRRIQLRQYQDTAPWAAVRA